MSVAPESPQESNEPPTQPLVSAGNSDRCSVCGAQLAVDQRYCVECGTRRGAPRFSLVSQSGQPGAAQYVTTRTTTTNGLGRFWRPTSSSVFLVGLLILLIALGVGVLIGRSGHGTAQKAGPINVVVNGGGSGGGSSDTASSNTGAASPGTGGSSSSSSTKSAGAKKTSTASAKKTTKAETHAATDANASASGKAGTAAAAKSFSKTATKKSTLGGSCTSGTAGCQNGKQTGNLF